ncbi:helix-turn-helix domain-containing protein [Burkholderia cepacia]|nr:helix-turn-helix domain-containing protein [Burkholderia cepacia]
MNSQPAPDIYRFSTLGVPTRERFDAWVSTSGCWSFRAPDDDDVSFDCQFVATRLGPFTVGQRSWLNAGGQLSFQMSRTPRLIRGDGLDHYYLLLQLSGSTIWRFGRQTVEATPLNLCFIDTSTPSDCRVGSGDAIVMTLPRHLFHPDVARFQGQALPQPMAGIVADYLRSVAGNLADLSAVQVPHLAQAAANLLNACLQTSPDTLAQADTEIHAILLRKAKRYIEAHLTDPDLSPDRICKAVGLSRPRLYRLFEPDGGVMRWVQKRRLTLIRNLLADPARERIRIADVAWRYGFVSDTHLSRSFKKAFGFSPRETLAQVLLPADRSRLKGASSRSGLVTFSDWIAGDRRQV